MLCTIGLCAEDMLAPRILWQKHLNQPILVNLSQMLPFSTPSLEMTLIIALKLFPLLFKDTQISLKLIEKLLVLLISFVPGIFSVIFSVIVT